MNKGLGQLLEMIRQSQALQEPENQKSTASCAGGGSTSSAIPTNSASSFTAARSTLMGHKRA